MVTCQSSELGWEVTVKLPANFLSLRRGSVNAILTDMEKKCQLLNGRISHIKFFKIIL